MLCTFLKVQACVLSGCGLLRDRSWSSQIVSQSPEGTQDSGILGGGSASRQMGSSGEKNHLILEPFPGLFLSLILLRIKEITLCLPPPKEGEIEMSQIPSGVRRETASAPA